MTDLSSRSRNTSAAAPWLPADIAPSSQENNLLALDDRKYHKVLDQILADMARGLSPSFLSIARFECLLGVAEAIVKSDVGDRLVIGSAGRKGHIFYDYLPRAKQRHVSATVALFKFAVTGRQLFTAAQLTVAQRASIKSYLSERECVQFIGTFGPPHEGHIAAIHAVLERIGNRGHVIVHMMGDTHPYKSTVSPYARRYEMMAEWLDRIPDIGPTQVTLIDLPGGKGLAVHDTTQLELMARVSGDAEIRWLIGSDKFLGDVAKIQANAAVPGTSKAEARFRNPHVHLYVVYRPPTVRRDVHEAIQYIRSRPHYPVRISFISSHRWESTQSSTAIRMAKK